MNAKPPFETLVTDHGDRVLRVCRAVAGLDDADDAWSETFLAALRAYPALPGDANHEAWLVTIAHHRSVDLVRGRRRRAVPVEELPARSQVSSLGNPGDEDTDLYEALARLPDKQRHTVTYHYLTGLSYAEIAGIVGGSADAARRAAADGVRALRRSYPGAEAAPRPRERKTR